MKRAKNENGGKMRDDLPCLKPEEPLPKELASILVVEDDDEIRDLLGMILTTGGYQVDVACSPESAIKMAAQKAYDLFIVERVLPEISGLEVIRTIRAKTQAPILLLTTQAEPDDILKGLEAGADDYMQKPFERLCLLTRVRSLFRRFNPSELAEAERLGKLMMGSLTMDIKTFDVFSGSERIQLTPSEFKLLHALALHRGSVLTREQLIELVQGVGIAVIDRAIDTHIFGLRKKLGTSAELVETVRGVGYRISG